MLLSYKHISTLYVFQVLHLTLAKQLQITEQLDSHYEEVSSLNVSFSLLLFKHKILHHLIIFDLLKKDIQHLIIFV